MSSILADLQAVLDKITTADLPEISMSGGGVVLALAAIKVRKRLMKVLLVLVAVGLVGFAIYRRLNRP